MHISKDSKLEKVLAKEGVEPILLHPFLRIEEPGRGTLLASDKFSAVIIPVETGPQDTSGPVHIEAVKISRKHGGVIRCEPGYCIIPGGVAYPRDDDKHTDFPPVDQLKAADEDIVHEVSLNAKQLLALAQAMGTETVTLRLRADTTSMPVEVSPHLSQPHVEGSWGFLMPYRIPGSV